MLSQYLIPNQPFCCPGCEKLIDAKRYIDKHQASLHPEDEEIVYVKEVYECSRCNIHISWYPLLNTDYEYIIPGNLLPTPKQLEFIERINKVRSSNFKPRTKTQASAYISRYLNKVNCTYKQIS